MPDSAHVFEANDGTFAALVLEESRARPVVVDFWAPWCAPCRALSPLLERLAEEGGGRFVLVKVNTDESSRFAGEFGVRGIPAVFAVRDGEVVDSFVGAIGEAEIRKFLDRVAPSESQAALREALQALELGDDANAARLFEKAGAPDDERVKVGRALLEARAGRFAEARAALGALARVPEPLGRFVTQARALVEAEGVDVEAVAEAVAANPQDVDAILRLASLRFARGQVDDAFRVLLDGVAGVKGPRRDDLRKRMVELFDAVGGRASVVEEARNELARLWFS
jgi:putative thioredoxin